MEDVFSEWFAWTVPGAISAAVLAVAAIALAWLRGTRKKGRTAASRPSAVRADSAPRAIGPAFARRSRRLARVDRWIVRTARRAPVGRSVDGDPNEDCRPPLSSAAALRRRRSLSADA